MADYDATIRENVVSINGKMSWSNREEDMSRDVIREIVDRIVESSQPDAGRCAAQQRF
jgi:hypothetical protein